MKSLPEVWFVLFAAFGFFEGSSCRGSDWPGWLGPNRDNSSNEIVVPWKGDLRPLWNAEVGEGHSSPVVNQGKVFLHFKTPGKEAETLLCLSIQDGKKIWETSLDRPPFSNTFGNGPRSTPIIHQGNIITHGASGQVACLSISDGKVIWKRDLLKDMEGKNLYFGASASPLIWGGQLMIPVGGKDAGIVALKLSDGSTAWKSLDDRATYSSPVIMGKNVLFLSQKGLQAVGPNQGDIQGHFPLVDKLNESATTPVVTPHGIFVSSVTYGGAFVNREEGPDFLKPIWKNTSLSCYFSTPVVSSSGDEIYMVTGSIFPPPSSTLKCVDTKTGKILWIRPKSGKYHAALLRLGDGNMLLVDDFGKVRLFRPNREKFDELASSQLCGATWAHPALADGILVIRDEKELLAVKLPVK
jgi:outer membrane protein assembly factor BamB